MKKTIIVFVAALAFSGCGRSTVSGPDSIISSTQVPGLIINGFGDEPVLLTSSSVVRAGFYYDISSYDSLWISFSVRRVSSDGPFDEILVKIGPTTYLRDSVRTPQKDIALRVKVSDISKPGFCAFTFWTLDPGAVLELSGLRVVGWMSN